MSTPPSPPGLLDYPESLGGDGDWKHPRNLYQHLYQELAEQSPLGSCLPEGSRSGSPNLTVVDASIEEGAKQTSYCGVLRGGHDLDRRDALYTPSHAMPPGTIYVAIWSEVKSLGQRSQTDPGGSDGSRNKASLTGKTLVLYTRIAFPKPKGKGGKQDSTIWDRATRDLAAKAIDARLDSLEVSRHVLSVFLANLSKKDFNSITTNDTLRLSQSLNTMLRDTRFTFDNQPATTFVLKKNAPEVSTRCRITVGGQDHLITFGKGVTTGDCRDTNKLPNFGLWEDGGTCNFSSIVDTSSNNPRLFPDTATKLFTDVSIASEAPQPPKDLDNCVMGNKILCRANLGEENTAESTSGPVN